MIAPLVRHMRLRGMPASILRTEGILIDPLGALLAVVVFEVVVADTPGRAALGVAGTVVTTVAAGCVLGLAGAVGLTWLFRHRPVPEMLQNALVLGTVVGVFGLAEWVPRGGLLVRGGHGSPSERSGAGGPVTCSSSPRRCGSSSSARSSWCWGRASTCRSSGTPRAAVRRCWRPRSSSPGPSPWL